MKTLPFFLFSITLLAHFPLTLLKAEETPAQSPSAPPLPLKKESHEDPVKTGIVLGTMAGLTTPAVVLGLGGTALGGSLYIANLRKKAFLKREKEKKKQGTDKKNLYLYLLQQDHRANLTIYEAEKRGESWKKKPNSEKDDQFNKMSEIVSDPSFPQKRRQKWSQILGDAQQYEQTIAETYPSEIRTFAFLSPEDRESHLKKTLVDREKFKKDTKKPDGYKDRYERIHRHLIRIGA